MRAALLVLLLVVGCVAPQRMGLTRVQVCLNAETGQRYDGPPRTAKGASVCADFEGAQ